MTLTPLADSFVLGVLRGFRILQAAGLTPDERRVILSSTHGSLEFEEITKALQTLWDEQFAGQRHQVHQAHFQESYTAERDEFEDPSWEDAHYAEDWSYHDSSWDWPGTYVAEQIPEESHETPEEDAAIREAQQAEKVAESLAVEAQRTWSEAQRATAALRKDGGFGPPCLAVVIKARDVICNGPHLSRDCPDRQHPHYTKGKSKGKFSYASELSPWDYPTHDDFYVGRSKGKKGKFHNWLESQAWLKGPRHAGSGKGPSRPPVTLSFLLAAWRCFVVPMSCKLPPRRACLAPMAFLIAERWHQLDRKSRQKS